MTVVKYSWEVFLALLNSWGGWRGESRLLALVAEVPSPIPVERHLGCLISGSEGGAHIPVAEFQQRPGNPSLPCTPRAGPCLGLGRVLAVSVLILQPPSSPLLHQPLPQENTRLPEPPSPLSCLSFRVLRASAAGGVVTQRQGPAVSFPTAPGSCVTSAKCFPFPGPSL